MRVHDSNLNAVTIGTRQTTRADTVQTGRTGAYGTNSGGQDRVSLSDLSSALARISDESPEQTQRISQLAAAYRSGAYRTDPAAVARGVVNDSIQVT
jgi:anti-sigma28 factor (negative regulator of flagellin synthesis)